MLAAVDWGWIARFAERLVTLRPRLWLPTATAIAMMSYQEYKDTDPESAAERYARDNTDHRSDQEQSR